MSADGRPSVWPGNAVEIVDGVARPRYAKSKEGGKLMRKYGLVFVALLVCLVLSGCSEHEGTKITLPYTLDLSKVSEGSIPREMQVFADEWQVVDNALEANFPPRAGDGLGAFIYFKGLEVADFDLSVTITFMEVDNDSRFAGILFRSTANSNLPRHKLVIRQGAASRSDGIGLRFRSSFDEPEWIERDRAFYDLELGRPYDVRVVVCGDQVKLFIDGIRVKTFNTDKWHSETGSIGFMAFGGRVRFSNIHIAPITPEEFNKL